MGSRGWLIAGWCMVLGALALGCSDGYSEDKAKIQCDQERAANASGCVTDDVYQQCMSCYQECGSSCRRTDTCPTAYACTDDSESSTTSSGSAGGSK